MSIHLLRHGTVQGGERWQPDPAGLFGGQQLVSNRAGVYAQAAINTSGNWNGNSRRAHDSQNEHLLVTDATNLRLLWPNDINDQAASSGLVHSTPSVALGLCNGASANALALDLRALSAPSSSLGDGMSVAVTVSPRDAVFGVPASTQTASKGGTVLGRVSVDRGNDTSTNRFPVQTTQTPEDIPANTGASQNVTGPGTKHAHDTKTSWDAYASGRLGFLNTTLLGDPVNTPISNVLVLGDSVENGSLDSTSVKDPQRAYVRRAIKTMQDSGMEIACWSMAQGNETLQNLRSTLETTSNLRRKILGAGCWSHVFIGHARNDIQNGRTAAQVIADYEAVLTLVRDNTPSLTKVFLGTLPPYTDASNNRLQSSVMDTVLAWQVGTATTLFDHVFDVGAVVAHTAGTPDRQKWATTGAGDAATYLNDGIHPPDTGHIAMAGVLTADTSLWHPTGF